MTLDLSDMWWTCMVCGAQRPDAAVSVAYHPVERNGEILPHATYNQRYCNDRPACIEQANRPEPMRIGAARTVVPVSPTSRRFRAARKLVFWRR